MSDEGLIDQAALDRLYEWGGTELRSKMIELFFENGQERMDGLRDGLEAGDLELAERSAHSLKSSAANLGALKVRALASEIEELLENGRRDDAAGLVPELAERFAETLQALGAVRRQESE